MGHPRSPTPILKNRTGTRSPSTSRPASQVSMYSSRSELRELRQRPTTPSAMSVSRPYSPYLLPDDVTQSRSKSPSYSRSVSPKRHHEKSVVIGPVTDLVTNRRIDEQNQEFYRFRDAHQGKPLDGRHGFMTYSWPYGLDIVSDDYLYSKRKPPAESPPSPKVPPPPIHRRARSVEPRVNTLRTPEPPVDFDIYSVKKNSDLNSSMRSLRHIVVDQVPVPTPPKFGTLTHGGRSPNTGPMLPSLDGPPCNLCHKPITEGRCIHAENAQYHCWHFVCSFCFKTLKQHDFVMADDSKPYCLNCFKKAFP
ncbi:Paxillin [Halotydeus destructor]|nr:Paxillin [Halotydeus destructor]